MTISKADRIATPVTWWAGRNDDDWVMLARAVPIAPWMRGLLVVAVLLAAVQSLPLRARVR